MEDRKDYFPSEAKNDDNDELKRNDAKMISFKNKETIGSNKLTNSNTIIKLNQNNAINVNINTIPNERKPIRKRSSRPKVFLVRELKN